LSVLPVGLHECGNGLFNLWIDHKGENEMSQTYFMMSFRFCSLLIIHFLLLSVQSFAAEVEGIPATQVLPDLVITKIFFTPEKPTIKDKVIINVEFKNIGSGPAYISPGMTEWETVAAPSST